MVENLKENRLSVRKRNLHRKRHSFAIFFNELLTSGSVAKSLKRVYSHKELDEIRSLALEESECYETDMEAYKKKTLNPCAKR